MSRKRTKKLPPEPVITTIESLSHDGRGIAHINGKITFIRNALPLEKVIFKYTNRRGKFDEGETIEIIQPAKERITSLCPHYQMCGGCSMQHMDPNAQLQYKQQSFLDQLKHFGCIEPQEILPPLTGPIWGYRHKARLGVRFIFKKDKLLVGFREKNGSFISDVDCCEVLEPSVGKKILALREIIGSLEQYKTIPQIEVAVGDKKTALILRHLEPLSLEDQNKLCEFAEREQFELYLQPGNLESVHKIYPTNTPDRLSYEIPNEKIELLFHPNDFTQINMKLNQNMIQRVIELLRPIKDDHILDLFCGLGNFTLPLAKYSHSVVGIEGSQNMVERGYENAKHNHIDNVQFYAANLSENVSSQDWAKNQYDKILLDPPRSGALEIIQYFPKFNAKTIVYVSCNPATFARDAGELVHQQGYQLIKVGIMDMFPHTSHVESIGLFVKMSSRNAHKS